MIPVGIRIVAAVVAAMVAAIITAALVEVMVEATLVVTTTTVEIDPHLQPVGATTVKGTFSASTLSSH